VFEVLFRSGRDVADVLFLLGRTDEISGDGHFLGSVIHRARAGWLVETQQA
jgi:hypothetical protein